MKEIRIENWGIVSKHPFVILPAITGLVYGHPKFDDGEDITTSILAGRDGEVVITQSGSRYVLGEVHPEFAKVAPDAKEQLLKALPEIVAEAEGKALEGAWLSSKGGEA